MYLNKIVFTEKQVWVWAYNANIIDKCDRYKWL